MPSPYIRLAQVVELAAAPAECASHVTGWLRMLPFRSLMSAHFTSPRSPRKMPGVPWYVPWASTTSSPPWNASGDSFEVDTLNLLSPVESYFTIIG